MLKLKLLKNAYVVTYHKSWCVATYHSYCTAQSFGRGKLWRIWWTISNLPKFYPPNVVSSNSELLLV